MLTQKYKLVHHIRYSSSLLLHSLNSLSLCQNGLSCRHLFQTFNEEYENPCTQQLLLWSKAPASSRFPVVLVSSFTSSIKFAEKVGWYSTSQGDTQLLGRNAKEPPV